MRHLLSLTLLIMITACGEDFDRPPVDSGRDAGGDVAADVQPDVQPDDAGPDTDDATDGADAPDTPDPDVGQPDADHPDANAQDTDTGLDSNHDSGTDTSPDTDVEMDTGPDAEPDPDTCVATADPYPSQILNASELSERQGRLEFVARDGNTLNAYTHRSPLFDEQTGQILFVMHGTNRNADDYLDNWRSRVDQHNALAIAPEFPKSFYSGSEDYQLGVGTSGTPYTGTYREYQWRNPEDYTHSEVEHLFEAVRDELQNDSCGYSIFGHSAGSQFVHRLLTFRPDARVETAVAGNAGWYTLPSYGDGGDNYHMPYGLNGTPPMADRQEMLLGHNLIVMLGEDDTERGQYFRTTPEADHQGLNRLERGQFYYFTGEQVARDLGVPFNWTLELVPNVGHSNSGLVPSAAGHIFRSQ